MEYLKVKYHLTGNILSGHLTKTFQWVAFSKLRAKIQRILEDTQETYLVLYRHEGTLIPIP